VDCIKTVKNIIEILSLSDIAYHSSFFVTKGCFVNLAASALTGAPNTRGSDFQPICGYILETEMDRGILTMEDE